MVALFPGYALFIALACIAVWLGIRMARRLPPWLNRSLGFVWVALHILLGYLNQIMLTIPNKAGFVLSNIVVLGSAVFAALLLDRAAQSRGALSALALTASIVDIVSFSSGVTRWLLEPSAEHAMMAAHAMRYLALGMPANGQIVAVVGLADLVFFGTFHLGLVRNGVRPLVANLGLICGLLVALAAGLVWGGAFGIPFMSVVLVAMLLWQR